MRRKQAVDVRALVRNELTGIINKTITYHAKQDPLSDAEKDVMWHREFAKPLTDALELLQQSGYAHDKTGRTDKVVFVVPDWRLGIRWYSHDAHPFLYVPKSGPHAIPTKKYGLTELRDISATSLIDVLGSAQVDKLYEWAKTAIDLGKQCSEARTTVIDIMTMIRTAGQLHRMVPELAQYLPDVQRQMIADQQRKSPYPDLWAGFDKARVDRMLVVLARGHLVKGLIEGSRPALGDSFSWAQAIP